MVSSMVAAARTEVWLASPARKNWISHNLLTDARAAASRTAAARGPAGSREHVVAQLHHAVCTRSCITYAALHAGNFVVLSSLLCSGEYLHHKVHQAARACVIERRHPGAAAAACREKQSASCCMPYWMWARGLSLPSGSSGCQLCLVGRRGRARAPRPRRLRRERAR